MNTKFNKILTISNLVSLFRLFLVIPTIYFLSQIGEHAELKFVVISIGIVAYLSDLLDGFLARRFDEITEFGKIIDPLADKVFVIGVIIQLYLSGEISDFYFWTILLRDVLILIGGIIVSKAIGKVLPSNLLGKITVASIALFLLAVILGVKETPLLFNILQFSSIILSFASVFGYGLRAYETITWYKKNGNS